MTQVVELLFAEVGAVVAKNVTEDRLPRQPEVVLAQIETADVVVAAAHIIVFACVLLAKNQVVEDHQTLALGSRSRGSDTSFHCSKK